MTKQEIKARIEELKTQKFYLEMKDNWTTKDFEYSRKLFNEIRELEKQVA